MTIFNGKGYILSTFLLIFVSILTLVLNHKAHYATGSISTWMCSAKAVTASHASMLTALKDCSSSNLRAQHVGRQWVCGFHVISSTFLCGSLFPLGSVVLLSRNSNCTQFPAPLPSARRRVTRCRASSASETKYETVSKTHFILSALSFHFLPL